MNTKSDAKRTRDPERTRERILDSAQALILDSGFSATTVDALVARAGITKGAFFHHFGSKSDLALALVQRYAALDRAHLEENLARAEKLASDPLQQVLILIGLYEEQFEAMDEPFPGCLFASYIYESKLFDAATLDVLRESTLLWRKVMRAKLEEVAAVHPPLRPVDMESLADLFYSLSEGAFIMTKTLGDKSLLARQARHLRTYLDLLFASPQAEATPRPS
ncbi:MAG: TetR/AcrR family transcriptional regulator [Burkholderiales bacterium]